MTEASPLRAITQTSIPSTCSKSIVTPGLGPGVHALRYRNEKRRGCRWPKAGLGADIKSEHDEEKSKGVDAVGRQADLRSDAKSGHDEDYELIAALSVKPA